MTKRLADILRTSWSLDEDVPPTELWRQPDWLSLWQAREHLIIRATDAAQKRGRSYRNFQVGVAAFVTSTKPGLLRSFGRPIHTVCTGANWKQGPDERNTCAEQEIVAQIRQQEHLIYPKEVLALVIAGEPLDEPDRESGVNPDVIHPCNRCRKLLREVTHVTRYTLIISVNLDNTKQKIMTFEELLKIHGCTFPRRRSRP